MNPTRPSIMSLGAIRSAPARAWETAVRASSSRVASLSTVPSERTTPQWPWLVYSHRHRSVITSRSGWASLIARVASWTTPSSSQAPEPSSSLAAGSPNRSTAGIPSWAASPGLLPRRGRSTGDRSRASPRSAHGGRCRGPRTWGRSGQPGQAGSPGPARAAHARRAGGVAGSAERPSCPEDTRGASARRERPAAQCGRGRPVRLQHGRQPPEARQLHTAPGA